ncbi:MAG: cupin domain-containing protein [Chitinophagaceae bacterium]
MEEKFNNSTSQRPEGDRLIDATLVNIDLPMYMQQIKEESSWKDGKRNAITFFKTNGLRIVLIALHEGAEMARHTADGIISVQVLEGKLQFNTDRQSVELLNGQMLALHERIPHSVMAIKETIFLLTLSTALTVK